MKDQLPIEKIPLAALDEEYGDLVQFRHNLGNVDALAASIREHGLVSPPVVWRANRRRVEGGDGGARYVVIDGSRRSAAIRQLEQAWTRTDKAFPLSNLSCCVHEGRVDAARLLSIQLHVDRNLLEDTNRGDEAVAFAWLRRTGWEPYQIQDMLGVSQPWVSQMKTINDHLTPRSMDALRDGHIAMEDALFLATETPKGRGTQPDDEPQHAVLEKLIADKANWDWTSVRANGVPKRARRAQQAVKK